MELVIRRMIERRVDGVAALTFSIEESIIKKLSQFSAPPLTTVRISQADLAIRAFQMLTHRDKTLSSSDEYVLKTSLVLRRSTALQPRSNAE